VEHEDRRLAEYIEGLMGGRVTSIERQARWRKAWFAELTKDGKVVPLYIRGDKQLDAEPYPGLEREAKILRLLEAGAVPVSHVHGYCADPAGIVMDRGSGDRDVSRAASDAERQSVAEQYIDALARMHSLDIEPFVAAGIHRPRDQREAVLVFLDANQPLYERTKRAPEPFLEFALRWARRNVPTHEVEPTFVHCDAGQFLFENGRLNCVYDFEASHIGDPLADLAALRTRDPYEPLGAPVDHLIRRYAQITGRTIDAKALSYHTAIFMLTAAMTLSGPLRDPNTVLQSEYLVWDLLTRRGVVWAMAECMGITVTPSVLPAPEPSRNAVVARVLDQAIHRIVPQTKLEKYQHESALVLTQWVQSVDARGAQVAELDMERVSGILGYRPANWMEADAQLEEFVLDAEPRHDRVLFDYFARQLEDQIALAEPVQQRIAGYAFKPVNL
jgi:aminoglycoside phosphotransferase (APT) family kinase protein